MYCTGSARGRAHVSNGTLPVAQLAQTVSGFGLKQGRCTWPPLDRQPQRCQVCPTASHTPDLACTLARSAKKTPRKRSWLQVGPKKAPPAKYSAKSWLQVGPEKPPSGEILVSSWAREGPPGRNLGIKLGPKKPPSGQILASSWAPKAPSAKILASSWAREGPLRRNLGFKLKASPAKSWFQVGPKKAPPAGSWFQVGPKKVGILGFRFRTSACGKVWGPGFKV